VCELGAIRGGIFFEKNRNQFPKNDLAASVSDITQPRLFKNPTHATTFPAGQKMDPSTGQKFHAASGVPPRPDVI
jgi:hypothetical protein